MFRGWAMYGDRELFNNNRLDAYQNTLVGTLDMQACDTCGELDDDYESPSADPAPWYSAAQPMSADFVGILPLKISGLDDDPREATPTQRKGDGGFISPVRRAIREVRVTALVIANSEPGRAFGMDWLRGTLNAGARGPVIGADPAFTAPDFIDINANCGSDRRDLVFYDACPTGTATADVMERTMRKAVCMTGPTVIEEFELASAWMYRVEFGFSSEDPWIYSKESDPIAPDLASGAMPTYTCTAPPPLVTISDPACPPVPAPPRPPFIPACYSDDTRTQRVGWYVDGADLNVAKATYPVITLDAGAAVSNLWLRVWPLAEGESDAGSLNACDTVGNMIVGYTAAGRIVRIDPSIQRATTTYTDSGQTFDVDTTHLLYPPESVPAVPEDPFQPLSMEWPVMYGGGPGYIIYAEAASGSALDISLTLVERR